jgi:hypothetical protein
MMPSLTFKLLFIASAPVFLMPTLLAWWTRRTGCALISLGNLVLWGCLYASLGSVPGAVDSAFLTLLSLIGWLVLLRIAISGISSRAEPARERQR